MYCEEDPYYGHECCDCQEKQDQLDNVKVFFRGVLDNLYGVNKLNLSDLENCLDEMAGYLGMKLPESKLQVRANIPMHHMLEDWKTMNDLYMASLKPKQHAGV